MFAAVGFYEYATGHLLLSNAKVQEANDLKPYFRVNSLFFDPNIYGRFLALTMVALAATLLWSRRRQTVAAGRGRAGACCGRGSCCRSRSRASRRCSAAWPCWRRCAGGRGRCWAVAAAAAAAAVALVLLAPGALEIDTRSENALDKATSGRFDLVRGALSMARDRPVWGFGSGSFAERYRAREGVRSELGGGGLAHDPAHRGRRAGRDRARRLPRAAGGGAGAGVRRRCAARLRRAPPGIADVAAGRDGGGVLRARAAHPRVRGVPRGPPVLDAAGDRRRAAAARDGRVRRDRGAAPAVAAVGGRPGAFVPWTRCCIADGPSCSSPPRSAIVLLGAAGAAAYLLVLKKPGDISNPDVPFVAPEPTPEPTPGKAKKAKPANFRWPIYGYTKDHRRAFEPAEAAARARGGPSGSTRPPR